MLRYLRLLFAGKLWAAILLTIRVGSGIIVQKIVAVKFGPFGTTALSHLQNYLGLFLQPTQDIAGQGLLTVFSKKKFNKSEVLSAALILSLSIFLLVSVISFSYQTSQIESITFLKKYKYLLSAIVLLLIVQILCVNIFISLGKLRSLVFLSSMQWLIIISSLLTFNSTIDQLLLAYVSSNSLFTVLFIIVVFIQNRQQLRLTFKVSSLTKDHFLQFLIMGLVIWMSSKLTAFGVRTYAMMEFSTEEVGYWQAVARVSDAYRSLFISFLMLTMVPTLAKTDSPIALKEGFIKHFKTYLLIIIVFLILAFILHDRILILLYSPAYLSASHLMKWQLSGDILSLGSIPFALLLMTKVNTRLYITAEIIGTLAYLLFIILLPFQTVEKILYAYFIRYTIYLTLTMWFSKKILKGG